jgi:hypothetical protein
MSGHDLRSTAERMFMQVPHLGEFPGPNSLVILDNWSCHHVDEVVECLVETGAKVLFLP